MYQFQCKVAEIHGEYHVQSLLLWQGGDDIEWVAGDAFSVSADQLQETDEHSSIMVVVMRSLRRIAEKHDRSMF